MRKTKSINNDVVLAILAIGALFSAVGLMCAPAIVTATALATRPTILSIVLVILYRYTTR